MPFDPSTPLHTPYMPPSERISSSSLMLPDWRSRHHHFGTAAPMLISPSAPSSAVGNLPLMLLLSTTGDDEGCITSAPPASGLLQYFYRVVVKPRRPMLSDKVGTAGPGRRLWPAHGLTAGAAGCVGGGCTIGASARSAPGNVGDAPSTRTRCILTSHAKMADKSNTCAGIE